MKTITAIKVLGKTALGATAYVVGGANGIIDKAADSVNHAPDDSVVGICRDTDARVIYRKGRADGYSLVDINETNRSKKEESDSF